MDNFDQYLLWLGLLLAAGALLSGLAHRSILSLAFFFLAAGAVLGPEVLGVLHFDAGSGLVQRVTELTLIVILFTDGLEVERGFVRQGWHVPFRSLLVAMPVTAALIALIAVPLLGLTWGEALLLGALLSPTDPVLTASVVTNPKIPARIRNSLNLESGFNDGLALPAVLIFAAALGGVDDGIVWWQYLLRDIGIGAVAGSGGAMASIWLLRCVIRKTSLKRHYLTLYAFAVAICIFGATSYLQGNGFIAVFAAGIVMAAMEDDRVVTFSRFSRDLGEVLKLATFVIFGSLVAWEWWIDEGPAGLLFVALVLFAARTIALLLSLAGTGLDWRERVFMAWFGPRGVACIAYSLLVLSLAVPGGERVFRLTALVVIASIVLHGASDTPLAEKFAARAEA